MFKSPERRGFSSVPKLEKKKEELKHNQGLGKRIKRWLKIGAVAGLGGLALDANVEKKITDASTGAAEKAKKNVEHVIEENTPAPIEEKKGEEIAVEVSSTEEESSQNPEKKPWDGYKQAEAEFNKEVENASVEDLLGYYEEGPQHLFIKYGSFFEGQDENINTDYDYESFLKNVAGRRAYLTKIKEKLSAGGFTEEQLAGIRDRIIGYNKTAKKAEKYPTTFLLQIDAFMTRDGGTYLENLRNNQDINR
jgi:hypothetical protein